MTKIFHLKIEINWNTNQASYAATRSRTVDGIWCMVTHRVFRKELAKNHYKLTNLDNISQKQVYSLNVDPTEYSTGRLQQKQQAWVCTSSSQGEPRSQQYLSWK